MFTGIIEEIGSIKAVIPQGSGRRIQVQAEKVRDDLHVDQSVAVNGVCLTVVEIGKDFFAADAVAETLMKSTLSQIKRDDKVNLERALRLQDRLGGHLVQGHIDGIGVIRKLSQLQNASVLSVALPKELTRYAILKGSIAIDGVSLTIAQKENHIVSMAIIPHTVSHTIFQYKGVGDQVNIEVDFLAKYIEQLIHPVAETKITAEWLKEQGY